jgi:hypothetical protein
MRKFVAFLFVALLGSQMIFSQVKSCVTFDSKRDLNGFKNVVLTWKDPFIKNELWPAYVSLINESLKEKGMTIPVSLKGITFILEHTQEYENSYFVQNDYSNGVRIGNNLEYRNVAGNPSNWAVFVYNDVVCMYAKIGCCNPQKLKTKTIDNGEKFSSSVVKSSVIPVPTSTSNPVYVKKDTVYVEREKSEVSYRSNKSERSEETIGNNYYINNALPYGYYGGRYYNRYNQYGCEGPVYHFNNGNNHHNGYTGNNNQYTGNSHNYTGSNYHFTGGNYSTGQGHMSTGRGYQNTGQGHMSGGRGSQNTGGGYGNTGGGRSNVSSSYGSGRGR